MTDLHEIHLDQFDRQHVGTHGAFVLRINRRHVERCIAVLGPNMGAFYDHPVAEIVPIRRAMGGRQ